MAAVLFSIVSRIVVRVVVRGATASWDYTLLFDLKLRGQKNLQLVP